METGVIVALTTAFLYGSWAVPVKTLKVEAKVQAFWLTFGHLLIALVIFAFVPILPTFSDLVGPFIGGIMWAVGVIMAFIGIKHLGIARAFGIWIPTGLFTSVIIGLTFFNEARSISIGSLLKIFISVGMLISAALLIISTSKGEKKLGNVKLGILMSLGIGLLHGSFFVPMGQTTLSSSQALLPASLGMVATTLVVAVHQKLKLNSGLNANARIMLGGIILGLGNMTALITIKLLGLSIGFPLTQLAIVINTLWGVLLFKEVTTTKGKIIISIGILLALAGAILLNYTRVAP